VRYVVRLVTVHFFHRGLTRWLHVCIPTVPVPLRTVPLLVCQHRLKTVLAIEIMFDVVQQVDVAFIFPEPGPPHRVPVVLLPEPFIHFGSADVVVVDVLLGVDRVFHRTTTTAGTNYPCSEERASQTASADTG